MPPLVGDAVNDTFVPEQIDVVPETAAGFDTMLTDGVINGFTTIVIVFEIAVVVVTQPPLTVIKHVTALPLVKLLLVKVALVPCETPPINHSKEAVPPPRFADVGVNVTLVPAQILVVPATAAGLDAILTVGVVAAVTVILLLLSKLITGVTSVLTILTLYTVEAVCDAGIVPVMVSVPLPVTVPPKFVVPLAKLPDVLDS